MTDPGAPEPDGRFLREFAELKRLYATNLVDKAAGCRAALNRALADGSTAGRSDLDRAAHKLAGSGATHGFPRVTAVGRRVQEVLAAAEGRRLSDIERGELSTLVAELEQIAARPEGATGP